MKNLSEMIFRFLRLWRVEWYLDYILLSLSWHLEKILKFGRAYFLRPENYLIWILDFHFDFYNLTSWLWKIYLRWYSDSWDSDESSDT